jgi:aminoglycoside 6'-N-acetyltransferase
MVTACNLRSRGELSSARGPGGALTRPDTTYHPAAPFSGRIDRLSAAEDNCQEVLLRPIGAGDEPELLRIHGTAEVRRWWGDPAPGFPWTDEPDATRLVIQVGGVVAGLIQFSEELEPRYRHATIDLFLDPSLHGRGLGTAVLSRLVGHLIEKRGHHRITIDPAAANTAAIRSYEKVGFRSVGLMRQYERDPDSDRWHDGLLMELLADGIPAAPPLAIEVGLELDGR